MLCVVTAASGLRGAVFFGSWEGNEWMVGYCQSYGGDLGIFWRVGAGFRESMESHNASMFTRGTWNATHYVSVHVRSVDAVAKCQYQYGVHNARCSHMECFSFQQ